MNNAFNIQNLNANNAAINMGGTVQGDQIGTQYQHAQDPEVKAAIAELQALLTQLQAQHPNVTTEAEALTIIDAKFTEPNHRLTTLRQQLFNPERNAQAFKAMVVEAAKHCLEKSLFAKMLITYLDKLSETPEQGA